MSLKEKFSLAKLWDMIGYLQSLRYAVIAGMGIALVLPKLFTAVIVVLLLMSGMKERKNETT